MGDYGDKSLCYSETEEDEQIMEKLWFLIYIDFYTF